MGGRWNEDRKEEMERREVGRERDETDGMRKGFKGSSYNHMVE